MGKKTKKPSKAAGGLEDIAADAVVEDCPLKRKGAIRFDVTRSSDGSAVGGVSVELDCPDGTKTVVTDGSGKAEFRELTQGAATYAADFAASGVTMLEEDFAGGSTSIAGGKRRIIPLQITQMGELIVEVRQDDKGAAGAMMDDKHVLRIAGGGQSVENRAKAGPVRVPPGEAEVTVTVAGPIWTLPTQNMKAQVKPGETTTLVVRAVESTWLRPRVWDVEGGPAQNGAWLAGAKVTVELPDGQKEIATKGATDEVTRVPKTVTTYKIVSAATPDEDDVYLFEELT